MTACTIETVSGQILIDSSGNGKHSAVSGSVARRRDTKVGTALAFTKGSIERQRYTVIMKHGGFESAGKYLAKELCDLSAYKGKKIRITVSGYRKGDGGYPEVFIYDQDWKFAWSSGGNFNNTSENTITDTLILPTVYDKIYCALYHLSGNKKMGNTIVMTACTIETVDTSIPALYKEGHIESTGQYLAKELYDLSAYKGKKIRITVSGYRKGDGGYPEVFIYDKDWKFAWSSGGNFNNTSENTLTDTVNIPHMNGRIVCALYHLSGNKKMDNTIVMTRCTIMPIEEPRNTTIVGIGKQWTHSRWIKINESAQDTTANPRFWMYGLYDYAFVDIASNDGVAGPIIIACYKDSNVELSFNIEKAKIMDDRWHHLVVMTDLQETYCLKKVYLDGKKIGEKRVNANFKNFTSHKEYVDMADVNGSLANLLFFDRLLNEQELLYLYLNPQYPVKNYTVADWAIDPDNPDSSIKNLTPKYLGVTETVTVNSAVLIVKGEKTGGSIANSGDWVLMGKTAGGWKVGVCYRWEGLRWQPLEPPQDYTEQYQAALYHICEIDELMKNTGHFGALFAKAIVAQEAFINKLAAEQAFLRQLVVQKLRIDSDPHSNNDFEAWFDKDNGLKINNNGEEVFRVDPKGFAVMKNARFEGEIDCQGFKVINISNASPTLQFSWSAGDTGHDCVKKILNVDTLPTKDGEDSLDIIEKKYYGDGQYGGHIIRAIIIQYAKFILGHSKCRVYLLSNSGESIDLISSTTRKDQSYITHYTEKDEGGGRPFRWAPSLFDFSFYTYNPSQKVIIPHVSFGKADIPNVLYRDENGFIKIS